MGTGANNSYSRSIKRAVKQALSSPLLYPVQSYYAGSGSIVMYHRVTCEREDSSTFQPHLGLSVHQDLFDQQISYFAKRYNCLDLTTAVKLLRQGNLPSRSLVVTFDDGYRDNLTLALPILEKYQVPATIYLTPGFVDQTTDLWWYEHQFILERLAELSFEWQGKEYRYSLTTVDEKLAAAEDLDQLFHNMNLEDRTKALNQLREFIPESYSYQGEILNWDEVKELDRHPLITIGAHTMNHPSLGHLSEELAAEEILESKRVLEEHLGHPVENFAYPFGWRTAASDREFRLCDDAGFLSAVTTRIGHIKSSHKDYTAALPRVAIDYWDSLPILSWKLSGMYAAIKQQGRSFIVD